MMEETLKKFGYPNSLIKEYDHWWLLCRPKQVTLGSLILLCKDEVDSFSKISEDSFKEFSKIINNIENKLKDNFQYEKINYLMLIMVDPEVHFHVIPRYSVDKKFVSFSFKDHGWPATPNMDKINEIDGNMFSQLVVELKNIFN